MSFIMGSPMLPYTLMPLQPDGAVNFREPPRGGGVMELNWGPKSHLLPWNVGYQIRTKMFRGKRQASTCKLLVDNMTAVTILNNMGTSHSWQLNELNKEIWTWCIHRGIWLTVAHIPGKTNVVADRESRQHRREIEWTLNSELYEEGICKL